MPPKNQTKLIPDKPTKIVQITNKVLADALEKPEEPEEPPRKEDPKIVRKGRCAYKLPVY